MDGPIVSNQVQKLLDDLIDEWFGIADERNLKYPVTFIIIGMRGQYLCGAWSATAATATD